jgi:hypothetical protein
MFSDASICPIIDGVKHICMDDGSIFKHQHLDPNGELALPTVDF